MSLLALVKSGFQFNGRPGSAVCLILKETLHQNSLSSAWFRHCHRPRSTLTTAGTELRNTRSRTSATSHAAIDQTRHEKCKRKCSQFSVKENEWLLIRSAEKLGCTASQGQTIQLQGLRSFDPRIGYTLPSWLKDSSWIFRLNSVEQQPGGLRQYTQKCQYSTQSKDDGSGSAAATEVNNSSEVQLTQREKLKRAVKEYGSTVIVFHITISLASLGGFYLLVSSGVDMVGILKSIGVGEAILQSKLATGTGTFVVAYAVHKVFAPVRIGITLTATPFIVRYLRSKNILKPPKRES